MRLGGELQRMRGREADALDAGQRRDVMDERRKIGRRRRRAMRPA